MSAKSCAMQSQHVKHLSMELRMVEGVKDLNPEIVICKVKTILLDAMAPIGTWICSLGNHIVKMVKSCICESQRYYQYHHKSHFYVYIFILNNIFIIIL